MSKGKVVVIEDNEMNIKFFKELLKVKGYDVLSAIDGLEGLNMVIKELPDLVILDIQLPTMNGVDIAKELRSNNITETIPIIAVTAFASAADKEEILAVGCNEYITKPFRIPLLSKCIEELLS